MNLATILLLAAIAAPIAAGAAWLSARMELGWNARQRVFNSAAMAPSIIAAGAACFTVVILVLGDARRFAGADDFLFQVIVAILAAFSSGMIAAYLVERIQRK